MCYGHSLCRCVVALLTVSVLSWAISANRLFGLPFLFAKGLICT